MGATARRGTMLHHHVPEPKETPPLVHRLRLELNRTVRRRVTEAVDAVCVAFEDDLTHLTSIEAENYELFYDCCSRLAQFIDKNMDTTPGFLLEMDRLIFACHSGASEQLLHSAMTKDLRIRRRDRGEKDDLKLEPSVTEGNSAIAQKKRGVEKEESSGSDREVAVGTTSRQWGTKKRLSTKNSPTRQLRSKRVKRTFATERRRSPDSEEDKQGGEEKKKERVSVRTSSRHARPAKRTSRRVKCARQLEMNFGERKRRGRSASSTEAVGADQGRKMRWTLRSLSIRPSTSTDVEEPKHPVAAEQPLTEAMGLQNEGGDQDAGIDQEDVSSESVHEPPVPGLCDAGMRPPQQVTHFKACLRKSIQFVDAMLCKPPPGKICIRNCQKIRSRQCREGIACRDPLCRNWHQTEAHTERCKNPLCELGSRVELREIMHQIGSQDTQYQVLWSEWKEKNEESVLATTNNSSKQYTEDELSKLNDELDLLQRRMDDGKEKIESLKNTREILLANLSAIGVKPEDDEADGFRDFDSHYK